MSDEMKYLMLLGLREEEPGLEFLSKLVKRHQERVPYESASKVLHFERSGPTLPSFSQYVAGIEERCYGGTCFAQNIHFLRLVKALGFNASLMGIRREGELGHVSLRVRLGDENYLVDLGIMSPVAGPYRLAPGAGFDRWVANQRFVFSPSEDRENYRLEIHRDGNLIRSFQSTADPVTEAELAEGVRSTYAPGAMFMTTLCVHRAYEAHSVGIWNRSVYRVEGLKRHLWEVRDLAELEAVFRRDLDLPLYPLVHILTLLEKNGGPPLFAI